MKDEPLLTRDIFRESVFERDSYKCVICGEKAQDAHHILERRLFPDGGYYLSNGASLCGLHHIKAEQTVLTCEQIREAAGIKKTILPPHFYKDVRYDKWGNIYVRNGTQRCPGELFNDDSVQKILNSVTQDAPFTYYVKYPRTWHLPWTGCMSKDDRLLDTLSFFNGEIVVSLKMDGENCLDGETLVNVDGQDLPIKEVCENKIYGTVLGVKEDSCELSKESILGHAITESDDWFLIELEDGSNLTVTGDHRIYLPELNCYREAKHLREGDILFKK